MKIAVLSVLVLGSCSTSKGPKLPEEIQYEASFQDKKENSYDVSRMPDLHGSELLMNGKPVAKLAARGGGSSGVSASWKAPKASIDEAATAKYSIRGSGACGAFEIPLEEQPEVFNGLKGEQFAKYLRDGTKFTFLFGDIVPPKLVTIMVDRGPNKGVVSVGPIKVEDDKRFTFAVANCTGALPVTVDGAPIGEIDLTSPVYLVTLEPGICHHAQLVGYGTSSSGEKSLLPASPITPLARTFEYFLEPAPNSVQVGGGGTVSSELVRAPCT